MNRISLTVCAAALLLGSHSATLAQTVTGICPVQLVEVRPTIKKKDVSPGFGNRAAYQQSRALAILIRNTSKQPVTGIVVRWGIVRADLSEGKQIAYGTEETLDLKPLETKTIETATINASGHRYNFSAQRGQKIMGHGAQVLMGGRVVAEVFAPPSVKSAFEKLTPVDQASDR
ncbi:MAG: hypothetical protein NTY01_11585 [Verrucomicrobia bacterium]|nr:hypothetical protein [Verrucomicrobiota bacterium]